MWARIENNEVVELINFDPTGKFHPSLIWKECNDMVKQGWKYVDGKFEKLEKEIAEEETV